jgi:hypothetical protein
MFYSKYLNAAQIADPSSRTDALYVCNSLNQILQCMLFLGIQIILYLQLIVDKVSMTSWTLPQWLKGYVGVWNSDKKF